MDNRLKILAIDDDDFNLKILSSALKSEYNILTVQSGVDAIRQIKEYSPDLILLDVMMPDMNGYEVCSVIKTDPSLADIPIIFLSAMNTLADELQGLELGGIDYLTKPVDLALLRLRVRNHLDLSKRNSQVREQLDQLACQKEELALMVAELELQNKRQRVAEVSMREMAKTLSEQFMEIRRINESLEQRVKERTEALQESERFTLDIIDSLTSCISVLDMNGMIVTVNKPWRQFGRDSCQVPAESQDVGKNYLSICRDSIARDDDEGARAALNGINSVLQGETEQFRMEYQCHTPNELHWFSMKVSKLSGSRGGLVVSHADITERKQAEKALEESNRKLEALSVTDSLTGIANRRRFDEVLFHEHSRHSRSGENLSLIMLDIDHFKKVNDLYGHTYGDDCLKRIASVIGDCVTRSADLAARYGGEEFACILPETNHYGAIAIAEKIRLGISNLKIPNTASDVANHITASLGLVTIQCTADIHAEDIVARADALLYQAKARGRNRLEFTTTRNSTDQYVTERKNRYPHLTWNSAYCCGNLLIDAQHQSLFQVSNELLENLCSDYTHTELYPHFSRLIDDIRQHFRDEEVILETFRFPGLVRHAAEHNDLLEKIHELSLAFKEAALTVDDVFRFLANEIIMQHMLGSDREFFALIKTADGRSLCE
jgi:diguanylate cyclase (GGDEF)-like protein/hemerythrin-like metal-binding protein